MHFKVHSRASGKPNIVLTGFMGTGKSHVGRLLAARLEREFIDMDAEIEHREGRKIAAIFESEGEACFRAMERELVSELSDRKDLVVATGGGVVLDPDNIRDFERTGLLVCLDAAAERVLERVAHEAHRPLLAVGDRLQRIRDLMQARRDAYATVALHVNTDGLTPEQVADRIISEAPFRF